MKRIVDGRTYNTDKSTHIARSEWNYEDDNAVQWDGSENLYQGRTGAFFLVRTYEATGWSDRKYAGSGESLHRTTVEVFPLTIEQATTWNNGETVRLGASSLGGNNNIEIITSGILPEPETV